MLLSSRHTKCNSKVLCNTKLCGNFVIVSFFVNDLSVCFHTKPVCLLIIIFIASLKMLLSSLYIKYNSKVLCSTKLCGNFETVPFFVTNLSVCFHTKHICRHLIISIPTPWNLKESQHCVVSSMYYNLELAVWESSFCSCFRYNFF